MTRGIQKCIDRLRRDGLDFRSKRDALFDAG
jgi:biotin operon repressor